MGRTTGWLLAMLACMPAAGWADTRHDESLWLMYNLQYALDPHWKLSFQAQPFWRDHAEARDQVTYRPGLYYVPNKEWSIGGGYVYFVNYPDSAATVHEHRWWGDVIRNFEPVETLKISVRTRLEHRFIEDQPHPVNGLREFVRISYPLSSNIQAVVSDDWWYTLNQTQTIDRGFDQNRLFIGIATPIGQHSSVEIGLQDQYVKRSLHDTDNCALSLTLNQSF